MGASLRSACARQCVVLVSRAPILDALTHALNTLVASAFASGVRSDAPSFAELAASLVDGLNVACHDSNTAVRHDSSSNMDEKGLSAADDVVHGVRKDHSASPRGSIRRLGSRRRRGRRRK